jgi:hypothetical protein
MEGREKGEPARQPGASVYSGQGVGWHPSQVGRGAGGQPEAPVYPGNGQAGILNLQHLYTLERGWAGILGRYRERQLLNLQHLNTLDTEWAGILAR